MCIYMFVKIYMYINTIVFMGLWFQNPPKIP